jgi:hypothetical protein
MTRPDIPDVIGQISEKTHLYEDHSYGPNSKQLK